jgi:hypothetical protein
LIYSKPPEIDSDIAVSIGEISPLFQSEKSILDLKISDDEDDDFDDVFELKEADKTSSKISVSMKSKINPSQNLADLAAKSRSHSLPSPC